jgi:hypothetical protein
MISKWQQRTISDYLFCLVHAAKTGKTTDIVQHAVMTKLDGLSFSEGLKITPQYATMLHVLATLAYTYKRTAYQLHDIFRTAYVRCPCKTDEDWQYLSHLLRAHYADYL